MQNRTGPVQHFIKLCYSKLNQIAAVCSIIPLLLSCSSQADKAPQATFQAKVVYVNGYIVPGEKLEEPEIIKAGKPYIVVSYAKDIDGDSGDTTSALFVKDEGMYILEMTTECGIFSDTMIVEMSKNCTVLTEIPNVITANNDGVNDVFSINLESLHLHGNHILLQKLVRIVIKQ